MIDYSIVKRTVTYKDDKGVEKTGDKYYATAQSRKTYDIKEFARHIADHGSVYSRGDIMAVLIQTVDCLKEVLMNGDKVNLGDLGSFYLTLNCDGADSYKEFTANNIKSVNIRFTPGPEFADMKDEASYRHVGTRKQQAQNIQAEATDEDNKTQGSGSGSTNTGGSQDNGGF